MLPGRSDMATFNASTRHLRDRTPLHQMLPCIKRFLAFSLESSLTALRSPLFELPGIWPDSEFSEPLSAYHVITTFRTVHIRLSRTLTRSHPAAMIDEEKTAYKDASSTHVVEGEKGDAVFGEYKEGDVDYKSAGW